MSVEVEVRRVEPESELLQLYNEVINTLIQNPEIYLAGDDLSIGSVGYRSSRIDFFTAPLIPRKTSHELSELLISIQTKLPHFQLYDAYYSKRKIADFPRLRYVDHKSKWSKEYSIIAFPNIEYARFIADYERDLAQGLVERDPEILGEMQGWYMPRALKNKQRELRFKKLKASLQSKIRG